jgi:hypothetical protein
VGANPPAAAFYAVTARRHRRAISVFAAAVRDKLNPPVIHDIALGLFDGRVGDEVIVHASDDTQVVEVCVVVKDMTGAVLERGSARRQDDVWVYELNAATPFGHPLTIEVTAMDRPGNEVTRTKPWVPSEPAPSHPQAEASSATRP